MQQYFDKNMRGQIYHKFLQTYGSKNESYIGNTIENVKYLPGTWHVFLNQLLKDITKGLQITFKSWALPLAAT
jgi:hypothetical protein